MPSPGATIVPRHRFFHARSDAGADLIYNEWDKHGTCSVLAPRAYFDTVRNARSLVNGGFGAGKELGSFAGRGQRRECPDV